MKQIVPISKELTFNTSVYEICSISLEHELNKKESELAGDFVISGEFKSHELSVNKEHFLFRVPFSVDLTGNVRKDSVVFEVIDFNYDLKDNKLQVDIEFEVSAEEEQVENTSTSILDDIDFENVDDLFKEEERDNKVEETIMDSIIEDDDNIVYKVHIVRENETIESICSIYNTSIDDIKNLNDLTEIKNGDKIIIPSINE